MKRLDYSLLQYAKITAIAGFVLLFLDLALRKPANVDKVLEGGYIRKAKESADSIPKKKEIEEYSSILDKKAVFDFPGKGKTAEESPLQEKDTLANFSFNGIIVLDKKYAAIFSKEDKKQYLVPEGDSIKGIKVEKIKQSSVVINVDNEEKEISF